MSVETNYYFVFSGVEYDVTCFSIDGLAITPDAIVWVDMATGTVLANGATYTPTSAYIGKEITCYSTIEQENFYAVFMVVDHDSEDDTEAGDEVLEVFIPSEGKVGTALTATVSPAPPSGVTDSFCWTVNDEVIENNTTNTFTPRQGDEGATIIVTVYRTVDGEEQYASSYLCIVAGREITEDPDDEYGNAIKTAHIRGGEHITLKKDGECTHDGWGCYIAKIDWDGLNSIDDYTEVMTPFRNIRFQGGLKATVANDICYVTGGGGGFVYDNSTKESYEIPRRSYVESSEGDHEEENNGDS